MKVHELIAEHAAGMQAVSPADEMFRTRAEPGQYAAHNAQKQSVILAHLNGIREHLAALERFGMKFDLAERGADPVVEYPKMLYHDALGSRIAQDEQEADQLSEKGWREKP